MIAAAFLHVLLTVAAPPDPWALMAERDLRAMHDQIRDNHPGPVDPLNDDFDQWLEKGLDASIAEAKSARTFGDYFNALRFYAAGFRDGHLTPVQTTTFRNAQVFWPGFVLGSSGGDVVVVKVPEPDEATPPVGSTLIDCGGATPRQILERDLIAYHAGPVLESTYEQLAPMLLWRRPQECRFRTNGEVKTYALRYRLIAGDAFAAHRNPDLGPLATRRIAGNGVWVPIRSFQGYKPEVGAWLKTLVEEAPSWRDASYVVFDVRRNEGGDSEWGRRILAALYGEPFIDRVVRRAPKFGNQYVEWRASKDNLAHVRSIIRSIEEQHGKEARPLTGLRKVERAMADALEQNRTSLVRPAPAAARDPEVGPLPPREFKGRVVLLTDTMCASSCLDFADAAYELPDFVHAGRMTNADSVYMEVRNAPLPSGLAELVLPVKVYRGRPRGHNVPYTPSWVYPGNIYDTPALERWLVDQISR